MRMSSILRYRRLIVVVLHLIMAALSNYMAFWLRFEGDIPKEYLTILFGTLPWLVVIRGLVFTPLRLYQGLWRYTSISDLVNIVAGVAASSLVFYAVVARDMGLPSYPRSVVFIDALLLIFLMGGVRLTRRMYRELGRLAREKRVLVYGAGDAGEMIVRDMRSNPFYDYEPIGFIDDNRAKVGQRIHGVRVLGTREDLPAIIAAQQPSEILVAITRATPATLRHIVKALEIYKVPIRTLPNRHDLLDGMLTPSQIRTLAVQDLLERAPVGLAAAPVHHLITGKRVLVTGAGGSIGSELSRQIVSLGPAAMVLLDRYENGLHVLATELEASGQRCALESVIADVTDAARIADVLAAHRPQIIFHAAAHKHVPLMELNPCEAVKNNVRGTRVVAEAARRFTVERLILISSDKAVNPSSVMGATKRVAELVVQQMNDEGAAIFTAVRFGNVLVSNGSVVPHFLAQIKAGGPVTVTHPDMRRYFMLIPEAVHLVLHAAALAEGGDIFVLEMGEQMKVLDLARSLIRLSGFVPDEEIEIKFIGLRPGEKLSEELVGWDETAEPSSVEGVLRVRASTRSAQSALLQQVTELEEVAMEGDPVAVRKKLEEVVPTYHATGVGGMA